MNGGKYIFALPFLLLSLPNPKHNSFPATGEKQLTKTEVRVHPTIDSLIAEEDTDMDKKITIDDPHIPNSIRGDKRFVFKSADGKSYEVVGTYHLANLLQTLKFADENKRTTIQLNADELFQPIVVHIAQSIKNLFWNGLTRRIDESGLEKIFNDQKTKTIDGFNYVYIPHNDSLAYNYFSMLAETRNDLHMKAVKLPEMITPDFVNTLNEKAGILSLGLVKNAEGKIEGLPFVVPGGRFNEMYGWDSYFIALGLLQDGKIDLAKDMVDNFIYEINYYGKILNANRVYYLTRSQPPFFTSMIIAVYNKLPRNRKTKLWLQNAVEAAIKEYKNVWMGKEHLTNTGLSRYFDLGIGPPPEVEPGRYDSIYKKYAARYGMESAKFEHAYLTGSIKVPELDKFFIDDRAMRESGNDASYRLQYDCSDLVTVDLNSLLYKIETDIAGIIEKNFDGSLKFNGYTETSSEWLKKAAERKKLMDKYLWNEDKGMYFDYNFVKREQTNFISATTFYPIWARCASSHQAERLIRNALPLLEMPGGIAGSTEESRGPITKERPQTQWDFPFAWAPQQILLWYGLKNYNRDDIAKRLIYKWLYTITVNAYNYNGTIAEKYDAVSRSSQVFAEYGNVGTKFSYITREGFGWTNASYVIGLSLISKPLIEKLDRLIPPEWIEKF